VKDEDLLLELVRTPSPTGHEQDAVAFLQDQARADGFLVQEDEVGNFIATAGSGDRLLLFVGHIDTVAGEIPVRVQDGELWGRGSVDAKGPLAAAYCAARRFIGDPNVRIMVVGAVDEEGASRGAKALQVQGVPSWIINGEPSGVHGVTLAYKGILRGHVRIQQEMAHGAGPEPSAADRVVAFWNHAADRLGFGVSFDAVQGRLDRFTTQEDGLMGSAQAGFQLRLPPDVSPEQARAVLEEAAGTAGVKLTLQEAIPAVTASRRTPLVAAFTSAIRWAGGEPRLLRKTGTSDMNLLAQRYPGVPLVAFGPGDSSLDHRPDERLLLSEFRDSVEILARVFQVFAAGTADADNADIRQQAVSG
jgi:[amino group carrier protein]-lysine/ornithine hydrolase